MRVHSFNGGPSAIPLAVLERTQRELLDFGGTGVSILETSFRAEQYLALHDQTIALLRELYDVPASHRVLLLPGSASQQFATLPMSFLPPGASADYVLTGHFSRLAHDEACALGRARIAGSCEPQDFARIANGKGLDLDPHAAYVHITSNNTSEGTEFVDPPNVGAVPLIADMSSNIFSRRIDIAKYDLIYAGCQKNLGPTGMVAVIASERLIAQGRRDIPAIWQYRTHAASNSLFNTPNGFGMYLLRNFLEWAGAIGGLTQLEAWNAEKARHVYAVVDRQPDFYRCQVAPGAGRSRMNVVFRLPTETLEQQFLAEAQAAGMIGLANHPAVGGLRVSLYNGVELAAVERLCEFMRFFAAAKQTQRIRRTVTLTRFPRGWSEFGARGTSGGDVAAAQIAEGEPGR